MASGPLTVAMPTTPKVQSSDSPKPAREDAPMTPKQAALLRQLAIEAYEPEAFGMHLTRSEAEQRIAALAAKLKLQDEPPHTL